MFLLPKNPSSSLVSTGYLGTWSGWLYPMGAKVQPACLQSPATHFVPVLSSSRISRALPWKKQQAVWSVQTEVCLGIRPARGTSQPEVPLADSAGSAGLQSPRTHAQRCSAIVSRGVTGVQGRERGSRPAKAKTRTWKGKERRTRLNQVRMQEEGWCLRRTNSPGG